MFVSARLPGDDEGKRERERGREIDGGLEKTDRRAGQAGSIKMELDQGGFPPFCMGEDRREWFPSLIRLRGFRHWPCRSGLIRHLG